MDRHPSEGQSDENVVLQLVLGTHWHGPLEEDAARELEENNALELGAALEELDAAEEEDCAALEEAREDDSTELEPRDDDVTAALEEVRLEEPGRLDEPREDPPDADDPLALLEETWDVATAPEDAMPLEPATVPSWQVPLLHTAPGSQSALVSHVVLTTHAVVPAHKATTASQRIQVRNTPTPPSSPA